MGTPQPTGSPRRTNPGADGTANLDCPGSTGRVAATLDDPEPAGDVGRVDERRVGRLVGPRAVEVTERSRLVHEDSGREVLRQGDADVQGDLSRGCEHAFGRRV